MIKHIIKVYKDTSGTHDQVKGKWSWLQDI